MAQQRSSPEPNCVATSLQARLNQSSSNRTRSARWTVSSDAGENFFLSSHWLRACEQSWKGQWQFEKIKICDSSGDLGLALLGFGTQTRHKILKSRLIAINQSTDADFDEVAIELNGFFASDKARFSESFDYLLRDLAERPDWDELRFSGLIDTRSHEAQSLAAKHGLKVRIAGRRPTYSVNLESIRQEYAGNYLATRSANTRQQLRRSLRALEKQFGETRLTAASCTTEALKWFNEIAPLHRARWPSDVKPTQFDNPKFVAFHETLINSSFESGSIDLLRLESGGVAIAYLYNLKFNGHISFYLSGIDYGLARDFHPGMLAHWLAIERYLSDGEDVYDFLMGQNQYKERLSTDRAEMIDLVFWRPKLTLDLEDFLRRVRQRVYRHFVKNKAGNHNRNVLSSSGSGNQ